MVEMNEGNVKELLEQLVREKEGRSEGGKVRIRDLEKRYLREKGKLSPKTVYNYHWTFDRLEKAGVEFWFTEAYKVNEFISSLDVNDTSRRVIFGCLKAIGRYTARTYGWADPTEKAERPEVAHKERRYLKDFEFKAVIGACRDVEDKVLIMALMDSGCRIKGLAGLRIEDLDDSGFSATEKTGRRHYRCDQRIVVLMREVAVDGVVFPVKDASRQVVRPACPCPPATLGERVRAIMKRAGLTGEKLGPHTLRHTAASLVARSSRSALAVKALLQQDDIKSAMVYIHDAEDDIQQMVSPLELSGVKMGEDRQVEFTGDVKMLESPVDVSVRDLLIGLFPDVPDGVRVRPALNSKDLNLIRDGLIELMRVRGDSGSGSECVQLIKRVLRKV
jgi:integrase